MYVFLATFVRFGTIFVCFGTAPKIRKQKIPLGVVYIIHCEIVPTLFLDALLSSSIHFSDLRLFIHKVYLLLIMERPTRSRKQPSRFADFEVSGDSGRVFRGRGRRGGFDGGVDVEISGDSGRVVRGRGRRGGFDGGVDVEVSGDSGRVVRGRGRRGGRGLAVSNQPIRPNALAIQGQTGNRILFHC
jgi:hypothetical protein